MLLLLPLAACATDPQPYEPVRNVSYTAIGADPFWTVAIGDDSIVLTLGPDSGEREGELGSFSWPRVLPRTVDGVRTWQSGDGTAVITVEAWPGPCTGAKGLRYEDKVTVSLSGRRLTGCGGRILTGRRV